SAPRVSCRGSNFTIEDVCKKHINISALTDCDLHVQYEFKSLNVEFGYLCSEGRWVKSSISVQMIGVLLGTLFFGTTSDRYGRKSVRLSRTYGVYKLEHVPKKHRFWVATVIAWAPNFILLNVIAYIAHDWRTFQRVLVLIGSPALILFFFVHESPRWLIQKGKIEEARKVLQRIQHLDRAEETKKDEMEKMLDIAYQEISTGEESSESPAPAATNFSFMTSMINYGLIFNIEMLSGSFFINSILMGSIRWSINIVFSVLDYKWKAMGRKAVHFVSQTSIALCLLVISITYISGLDDRYAVVIRVSTIIAAATTAQIFITKSISGMEYYPTVVRNSGMALKSTCSRLGTILAPQLFLVNAWQSLPYVVLTVMATLDTIAFQLVIPETKGKPLPENMPEKRKRSKAMAKRQNSFVNAKV
ncbi:hypothetical protein NECAME_02343, partial [Necator americanus]